MFVGRKIEMQTLKAIQARKAASFIVLQGRRRIGKSRLIEEFGKNQTLYQFIGLEPTEKLTAQDQRNEFCRCISEQFNLPKLLMEDWGGIFSFLATQIANSKSIVLLDEISWMAEGDSTFLSKLKNAWDILLKKNTNLMLVVCGSVSSWIEKNIISNTLFLGRPTEYMRLQELSLNDCNEFWVQQNIAASPYEKLKLLSVTGGVPRYLELINPVLSAEENIRAMCFSKSGALLGEFKRIFSDVFGKRSQVYRRIVTTLVSGSLSQEEILSRLGRTKTGDISEYLSDLVLAGIVVRDYTWLLDSENVSKLSKYRLKDNYVRFYLKYISPNLLRIDQGLFDNRSLASLTAYEAILGLQFENLVVNNAMQVLNILQIKQEEVVFMGPYFQRKTQRQRGCQIDFLIHTRFGCLYLCEIKFSKNPIKAVVVEQVKTKIDALSLGKSGKSLSVRPVLIHVNGVADSVNEMGFFASMISFGDILEMS
jgi:uncharacterized protein